MRILVVSPFVPHPAAAHGGAVCLGSLVASLTDRAEVALAALAPPAGSPEVEPLPAGLARSYLISHSHLRDLGGLARAHHKVRMLARWGAGTPVLASKFWSPALAAALTRAIAEHKPHAALVEFAVMAQYLPYLQGVPTILTDHENGDPQPVPVVGKLGRQRDEVLWHHYVAQHYRRADALQALTPQDAEHLAERLGRPVEVRPTAVPLPEVGIDPATSQPVALFLGNYLHTPNPEAAAHLATVVWPRVLTTCPHAELWLAGPDPLGQLAGLETHRGIRVLGRVEDLAGLLAQVRMLAAPLFRGTGIRIKILTAMAHGLPVVSNRLGMQGIDAPTDAAARGETPDELATAIRALLADPAVATARGRDGRAWVRNTLSGDVVAELQLRRLAAVARLS